jgi:hypothetical protein
MINFSQKKKSLLITFVLITLLFFANYFYLSKKNKTQITYEYSSLLNELYKTCAIDQDLSNNLFAKFTQYYSNNLTVDQYKYIEGINIIQKNQFYIITLKKEISKEQLNKLLLNTSNQFAEFLKLYFENELNILIMISKNFDKYDPEITVKKTKMFIQKKNIESINKFNGKLSDFNFVKEKKNSIFISLLILHFILLSIIYIFILKVKIESN